MAAILATQEQRWLDAALLWRDIWRLRRPDPLAAACAAEAALQSGQFGFADHMLAQLETWPDYLVELVSANASVRDERARHFDVSGTSDSPNQFDQPETLLALKFYRAALRSLPRRGRDRESEHLARKSLHGLGASVPGFPEPIRETGAIRDFFRCHPLALLADMEFARLIAEGCFSLPANLNLVSRSDLLKKDAYRMPPENSKRINQAVSDANRVLASNSVDAVLVSDAIVNLFHAGLSDAQPIVRETCRQLQALYAAGRCSALTLGWTYHRLGLGTYARLLMHHELKRTRSNIKRREIAESLASMAAYQGRYLDHADVLTSDDFAESDARNSFQSLCAHFQSSPVPVSNLETEPLYNAFDYLLSSVSALDCYRPPCARLLLVGSRLAWGGVERLLSQTYRHFSREGIFKAVDMALLNFRIGEPSAFLADEAGIAPNRVLVLDADGRAEFPFSLLPGDWKVRCKKLFDHIDATKPSVVHAWDDPTGVLTAFAALKAGCPRIVIHIHHCPRAALARPFDSVASYPAVFRRLLSLPQVTFVFCSEAAARDYAEWWCVPYSAKFTVLHNGFEWKSSAIPKVRARQQLGIPSEAFVIGTVFRFTPVKQPLAWARAAILLARKCPDTHFLMVGDGWLRQSVKKLFIEAGLNGRFHLTGSVSNAADCYAAMDLFWLTSRTEGLGNVLIEAQYSGIPVLAFDTGGVREAFIEGQTGFDVPHNDIDELVEKSLALLRNPAWLTQADRRARNHAHSRFNAKRFFDGLQAIYLGEPVAHNAY